MYIKYCQKFWQELLTTGDKVNIWESEDERNTAAGCLTRLSLLEVYWFLTWKPKMFPFWRNFSVYFQNSYSQGKLLSRKKGSHFPRSCHTVPWDYGLVTGGLIPSLSFNVFLQFFKIYILLKITWKIRVICACCAGRVSENWYNGISEHYLFFSLVQNP